MTFPRIVLLFLTAIALVSFQADDQKNIAAPTVYLG